MVQLRQWLVFRGEKRLLLQRPDEGPTPAAHGMLQQHSFLFTLLQLLLLSLPILLIPAAISMKGHSCQNKKSYQLSSYF